MSGDVQPRKRKDKRRKKGQLEARRSEEYLEERAANILRRGSRSEDEVLEDIGSVNPDEVIHVQKDALLGGNICAKVVFFCLLGAIVVMVGLIIVEYRGSKSVETQTEVDSPWSQMLEGWIDSTSPVHHDDHAEGDTEEASGEEHSGEEDLLDHGHDEDEGGGDDEHENDENDDDGEEDDDASKEDHKTLEGSDENDNASGEEEEEEEEDEEDEDGGEDDEEDDEQNKSEETLEDHNLYQDDEVDESDEVDDDAETGHSDEDLNDGNDEDDEGKGDDFQGDHELPGIIESGEDDDDDDDNDENQDVDQSFHLKDDVSEEAEDGEDKTFDDITQDEGEERYAEKISENTEEQEIDENEPTADDAVEEEETSGVALKFGVGVALVVVAHVVLVRKWNSAGEESVAAAPPSEPVASSEPEIVPETLTRRQTLVAPPAVEELPPVKPPSADPEYEEEAEEEEEEEEEEESEKIKQTLEELKETYSHLTPEGSDLEEEEEYDYTPKFTKNVTYAPTPPESDQEQSEPEGEEDEEEEEEEEEEDPMRQWQSRQAAHLLAEEVEDVQTGTEEEESDDEPPPPPPVRRKGPQEADEPNQQDPEPKAKEPYINAEITNQYDWDFYEDLDVADRELNEGGYFG